MACSDFVFFPPSMMCCSSMPGGHLAAASLSEFALHPFIPVAVHSCHVTPYSCHVCTHVVLDTGSFRELVTVSQENSTHQTDVLVDDQLD